MARVRRTAEDWRRVVFRSRTVAPRVRLALIYLADFMTDDRKVSRPRHLIAADLGVSERSIDSIISEAHEADLLMTIVKGRKGTTAIYQGTFPDLLSANPVLRANATSQREAFQRAENARNLRAESGDSANPGVRTTTKPTPFLTSCEPCGGYGCPACCGEAVRA